MTRELLILRHAKSSWESDALTDFDRPLAKRGMKDAPKMGRWMKRQKLVPDYVVSSPAERARETTIRVCKELGVPDSQVNWEPRVYAAGVGTLLEVLAGCPESAARVLLVGHNPGLEELLDYLVKKLPQSDDGKLMPTAALAHLGLPDTWRPPAPDSATLLSLLRVRSLP